MKRVELHAPNREPADGRQLPMSRFADRARRYHEAIHRILMQDWDPIGVADVAAAQNEYDSYVAGIYSRLIRKVPRHELVDYLWWAVTDHMGLRGNLQLTEHVVDLLLKVPEELDDGS